MDSADKIFEKSDQINSEIVSGFNLGGFEFIGANAFLIDSSEYIFLLAGNGCSIVLQKDLFYALKDKSPDDELKFKLVQHGLATVDGSYLPEDIRRKITCGTEIDVPSFFLIDVTNKCNLNCAYCFRDFYADDSISDEVLIDICNYIYEACEQGDKKKISIQLWGGEPILAMDSIRLVHQFFKKKDLDVDICIETNGTCITESVAEQLFRMGINVGVSIDGTPECQDEQRPAYGSGSSSKMVENGIHILNKYYDGKFGFITVVTKRNYSEINTIVKYFTSVLSLFSGKFNIVRDNANIEGKNLLLNATEIKGFAEDLYCLVEMYNLMGIKFDETNIMTRVRNLTGRENTSCCASNGCYGGISLISFDKYGNIYPCDLTDSEELRIGSIYEGSQRKNGSTLVKMMGDSIKSNRYFDAISDKDCVMCPWNYFCKGGCRAAAYYKNISGVVDEVECLFNKTIYPLIIRSILSKKVWFEKG